MDVLVGGLAGVLFSEQPVELETFETGLAVQNKLDRTGGRIFDWVRVDSRTGQQGEHIVAGLKKRPFTEQIGWDEQTWWLERVA